MKNTYVFLCLLLSCPFSLLFAQELENAQVPTSEMKSVFSSTNIIEAPSDLQGTFTIDSFFGHNDNEVQTYNFSHSDEKNQIIFLLCVGTKIQTLIRKPNDKYLHVGGDKNWSLTPVTLHFIKNGKIKCLKFFFTQTSFGDLLFQKVEADGNIYTTCAFYSFLMPNGHEQLELFIPELPYAISVYGREIVRMP